MKKFELTENKINYLGKTLFQIKACKSFLTFSGYKILSGDLGGFVENETNLDQIGNAWIFDNAAVCDNAKVSGDALIGDTALVCDNAIVCGDAKVCASTMLFGNA